MAKNSNHNRAITIGDRIRAGQHVPWDGGKGFKRHPEPKHDFSIRSVSTDTLRKLWRMHKKKAEETGITMYFEQIKAEAIRRGLMSSDHDQIRRENAIAKGKSPGRSSWKSR